MTRLNYSLTQLEYVLALLKHGHFAKAAEACSVTQPTLSMQIQKLEDQLGVVLFDRSKKPILVTEKGQKIIAQMQAILFEAKKLEGIVQNAESNSLTGSLTLGVIPTIAPYLLPRLLPVLEKKQPGISLRILELQTHRIVEALQNDEIDAGLLATPLKLPQIHEYPLYYEPFSVLCRKTHPLSRFKKINYRDLTQDDLWLLEEGHCLRTQILDVCQHKKNKTASRRFEFESGSLETLKHLVQSYGGYTLLPALACGSLGSQTLLLTFERPIPAREIGLVYRREYYKAELIEALAGAILGCLPEGLQKLRPKDLRIELPTPS